MAESLEQANAPEVEPDRRTLRLGDRLAPEALDYTIPSVATRLPYFLGSLTLTSIVVAALTGFWLSLFYQPSPNGAHASVVYLVEEAPFGDLARNVHWWSANLAVFAVLFHLSWVFYRGSYRSPREITWWATRPKRPRQPSWIPIAAGLRSRPCSHGQPLSPCWVLADS